jgi:P27 family predicted phage terminase small subunit
VGIRGRQSAAERLSIASHRSPNGRDPRITAHKVKTSPRIDALTLVPPPKHLTNDTKAWWTSIVATYVIEQHQYRILLVACEALDRREQARTLLKKHGLTFTDSKGMIRQRPEVIIERDSSSAFMRALRALKLEMEAP